MLNLDDRQPPPKPFALFELGFRPFFLLAGLFAVIAMGLWFLVYRGYWPGIGALSREGMSWHGHEMIYGYALAVVAGFLLTAVRNWTGVDTARGWRLASIALCWALGRIAFLAPGEAGLWLAALGDGLFLVLFTAALLRPIARVRQWKQLGILSKLVLLLFADALYYAGVFGYLSDGVQWGLFSGLYLILALIFVMARRVIPFFIERGVDEEIELTNWLWLDIASLALFLAWAVVDVFFPGQHDLLGMLSLALVALHGTRLVQWHAIGIWRKPLLWSLYLGYAWLVLGFALTALSAWGGLSAFLALHAFAVGGIGLTTLGMMSRVALGHTGRNVFEPPALLGPLFALLSLAALARVFAPILMPGAYRFWIVVAQWLWMSAFAGFVFHYLPVLIRPRVDGRPG